MKLRRIGIMGGTFDPVHLAHLIIAQEVLERLKLDQIWFVPCHTPPHKLHKKVSPARHRLNMLNLAVKGDKRFKVSDVELRRGGVSYTVDTLKELRLTIPRHVLYLILGTDNIRYLKDWKKVGEVFKLARVVWAERPGSKRRAADRWVGRAISVEIPQLGISSTKIRQRVRNRESITYWVPEKVRNYILKHGLYRKQTK